MKNSRGLAEIPLMIGLLLMAIAIPAVTKLAQKSQENRGKAAYTCSETTHPTTSCVIDGVTYGWTCNTTSGLWDCVKTTPVATATPIQGCSLNGCSQSGETRTCSTFGIQTCVYNSTSNCLNWNTCVFPTQTQSPTLACSTTYSAYGVPCCTGYVQTNCLNGQCTCALPTLTPTSIPVVSCSDKGGRCVPVGQSCGSGEREDTSGNVVCGIGLGVCCLPNTVTNTPTIACSKTNTSNGVPCCSGLMPTNCTGSGSFQTCVCARPTNTPIPTAIPTIPSCNINKPCPTGMECTSNQLCVYRPTLTPTIACSTTNSSNGVPCCSGYVSTNCSGSGSFQTCVCARPTATPTASKEICPQGNPLNLCNGKNVGQWCFPGMYCKLTQYNECSCSASAPSATPTAVATGVVGTRTPTITLTPTNTLTPTKTSTLTPTLSCLPNGRTTTDPNKCCSLYAAYNGSQLTCMVQPTPTNYPDCVSHGGQCINYASSCANVGLSPLAGYCKNGDGICCTRTGPTTTPVTIPTIADMCTRGNMYCENNVVHVCKADKSGYTSQACATGYVCDSTGTRCVVVGAPTFTPSPTLKPTPTLVCRDGDQVIQPPTTCANVDAIHRVCNCSSNAWSCFCDVNGDKIDSCMDHLNGTKNPNGGWLHFDDEASAICVCGAGNYHTNSNGKYACGSGQVTSGPTKPVTTRGATPTPPENCHWQDIQCVQAPCDPILICDGTPTATPAISSIPTITPGGSCIERCPNPNDRSLLQSCTPPDVDGSSNDSPCNQAGRVEVCGGQNYCCPSVNGNWSTNMTAACLARLTPTVAATSTPVNSMCKQCPSTFSCYGKGSEYRWFATGYVMDGFVAQQSTTVNGVEMCGGTVPKPTYLGKTMGDANCDGFVEADDYSLWHKEFYDGEAGSINKSTWNADFTGPSGVCDGIVDTYDYSLWHRYFYELMGNN